MKVSVIIVNYNVRYFLEVCLDSVTRALNGINSEIIIIDNQSSDDSLQMIQSKFPNVKLISNNYNAGFGKANNQGVKIANGEYILFLNPDTVMEEAFFQKTIAYLDHHQNVGAIGPRLIDGKGKFAPDGKKGFPTLSVALFKTTGINKMFPKSPIVNGYYAVHIGEHETAKVDVLSGSCMMIRTAVLEKIEVAFDEDFFMYCEDVDLCYRINEAGFDVIYFPETTVIHYKGESTRKTTLSYIKIFNDSLSIFVKKHYQKKHAQLYIFLINIGIVVRALFSFIKNVFKLFRMPLFDSVFLLATLWFMKNFWIAHIKNIQEIPTHLLWLTLPFYLLFWSLSMFINGAYDPPYRPLKVVRGMLMGTIVNLAYYGILSADVRFSRALIILSGIVGTVALLVLHELLYKLGLFKFIPFDEEPRKSIVVGTEMDFEKTIPILQKTQNPPQIFGWVSLSKENNSNSIGTITQLPQILQSTGAKEVIFCMKNQSYKEVLFEMQHCTEFYDYKIHIEDSNSFVGSNSDLVNSNLYTTDKRYRLSQFTQLRNKRIFDIFSSLTIIILLPFLIWTQKNKSQFIKNLFFVMFGKKTWVSIVPLSEQALLPKLKPGIIPPYTLQPHFEPNFEVKKRMNEEYALKYRAGIDFLFLRENWKFLDKV